MAAYSVPKNLMIPRVAECYENAVAIVPTDNTAIGPYSALYVGSFGDVQLCPANSATVVVFKAVPAGTLLKIRFQGVDATNTTAGNLVGLG